MKTVEGGVKARGKDKLYWKGEARAIIGKEKLSYDRMI